MAGSRREISVLPQRPLATSLLRPAGGRQHQPMKLPRLPLPDHLGEGQRVPVRRPHAAVRLRLADGIGVRRAVDALDPDGLFFIHHGVGSEAWSTDGFEREGAN